jgi:outer membrane immunogenic protein
VTLRKLATAGFVLTLCGTAWSPVVAADFGDAAMGATRSWNGCYVGAHAGGEWGRGASNDLPYTQGPLADGIAWNSVGPNYESIGFDTDGSIAGGAEIGCDAEIMFGGLRVVIGGVADISATDLSGLGQSGISSDTYVSYSADWLGSLRARAGVATPDLLVFASGGLAFGNIDVRAFDQSNTPNLGIMDVSGGGFETGWVVGGGAEWRVAERWSVSFEYLHHEFSGIVATGPAVAPVGAFPRFENDLSFDTVRVGIKFRM